MVTSRPLGKHTKVLENRADVSETLRFQSLRNLKKHIRNNAQTEMITSRPLGKETKVLENTENILRPTCKQKL